MNRPDELIVDDPVTRRQQRNAVVLGLILGAACLALMVACIIIFGSHGLPKDPKEWKRLQQQRAAAAGTDQTAPLPPQKDQTR
jgi:hypothetical protein